MKKALLLSISILTSLLGSAQRECELSAAGGSNYALYNGFSSYAQGQTFTACRTGKLESLSFDLVGSIPATIYIHIIDGGFSGPNLASVYPSPLYGTNTIDLSSQNIILTEGQTYGIRFNGPDEYRITRSDNDVYAGGSAWASSPTGSTALAYDLQFTVNIKKEATATLTEDFNSFVVSGTEVPDGWETNAASSIYVEESIGTSASNALVYSSSATTESYITLPELIDLHTRTLTFQLGSSNNGGTGPSGGTLKVYQSTSGDPADQSTNTLLEEITVSSEQALEEVEVNFAQLGNSTQGEFIRIGFVTTHGVATSQIIIDDVEVSESQAPSDISLSATSIDENEAIGSVVGTLSTTDPTSGDTFAYTVGGTDAASFSIGNSNELQLAISPDFETKNSYEIEITTEDALGETFTKAFSITINNVVELGPNDEYALYAFTGGTFEDFVEEIDGIDYGATPDIDRFGDADNAIQIANANFAAVADPIVDITTDFSINAWIKLETSTNSTNKYIVDSRHHYTSGGEVGGMSVLLDGSNELRVQTFKTGSFANTMDLVTSASVNADSWYMVTVVGSGGDVFVYLDGTAVASGTPSSFQNGQSWTFGIIAQSSGNTHLRREFPGDLDDIAFFQKALTENEIATLFSLGGFVKNDAPTDIELTATAIDENVTIGSTVATLSTTDPNLGNTHTYTISGTDASFFDISDSDLITIDEIDFETQSSFEITITTTDNHGATYDETFTITANDINDAPSAIELDENEVSENEPTGTYIGDLAATDDDANETFTFSTTSTEFTIDGVELYTASSFDYETSTTVDLEITVTDSEGASYSETLTINILDVDYPQVVGDLKDKVILPGFGTYTVDLSDIFYHDNGLTMTYQAYSHDSIATVSITDDQLVITEVAEGSTPITIIATDENQNSSNEQDCSFTFSIADISSNLVAFYPTS
ncbi:MAG: hypothetical protein CMB89_12255, partial [Flammeovirgaceae bacterium]|nr:hypothetical protein [Flammeovirgaceae bacterium]